MRFSILLWGAVMTTCLTSARAENLSAHTQALSLRECINLALSKNLELQIQYLSADIARYNLYSSQGVWSPTLSVSARHDYVSQPGNFDPQKFNPDFPYELNQDNIGTTLSGELPMGLNYSLGALNGYEKALTDFRSDPDNAKYYAGGIRDTNDYFSEVALTLRQHLLKDFLIDQERQNILIRRKDVAISKHAVRFQMMKTILAVELAYYDLSASRERVTVQEQALKLRQQVLKETQRRIQVGDLPPLDEKQAETQLQNTLTAMTVARENVATFQNTLKMLLTDNFREWVDTEIEPSERLLALPSGAKRSECFQSALANRPDLLEARVAIEKQNIVIKYRKNQLLPSLDLVGKYGGLGIDTSWSDAFNDAYSMRDPEYYYGVVLAVPLSNRAERGNYQASVASKKVAELQLKKAEQEVLLQIANLLNQLQSRYDQVVSTRKARAYAEEALSAEEKKLQNGLSTSFIVLQLQETLTTARVDEVQATANYNKTLAQLAFADGSTLEKNHLTIEVR
jgi:outer membrane protein